MKTKKQKKLAKLYLKEIVRLNCVSVLMILDRDVKFTSIFWKELQTGFVTRLEFNTASHPQTDGYAEQTIQTLEVIPKVCALDFPGSWVEKVFGTRRSRYSPKGD